MLEDCLVSSRRSARSKKPLTLVLSVLTHSLLLGALILIPLFQNQVLPQVAFTPPLPPLPSAPRPYVRLAATGGAAGPVRQALESQALIAPRVIPAEIVRAVDSPSQAPGWLIGASIGAGPGPGGPLTGELIAGEAFRVAGPPPPPPPAPPAPPPAPPEVRSDEPLRISQLEPSSLINQVKPVYPRLALAAGVEGVVVLEAVVTREGRIDPARLRAVTGHPLLVPAALEAVQQWRYRPVILNGVPIEVVTTITVNFRLH